MNLSNQIRKSVERVAAASIDQSWKGARRPEEHAAIDAEARVASVEFNELMRRVDALEARGTHCSQCGAKLP